MRGWGLGTRQISELGKFLKNARLEAGLSQYDVAQRLKLKTSQFVSNWERGLCPPSSDALPIIAKVLHLPEREFLAYLHRLREEALHEHYRECKRGARQLS